MCQDRCPIALVVLHALRLGCSETRNANDARRQWLEHHDLGLLNGPVAQLTHTLKQVTLPARLAPPGFPGRWSLELALLQSLACVDHDADQARDCLSLLPPEVCHLCCERLLDLHMALTESATQRIRNNAPQPARLLH